MTRLTNRADQLRVTPDTLVESLYRIHDTYFAEILTSLDHDRRRSEMVQNDIRAVPHRVNRSILESPVIGWAPHPSVQEITLGSGHTYDLPTTPESLRQWLRPMPTRTLPPCSNLPWFFYLQTTSLRGLTLADLSAMLG